MISKYLQTIIFQLLFRKLSKRMDNVPILKIITGSALGVVLVILLLVLCCCCMCFGMYVFSAGAASFPVMYVGSGVV